MAYSNNKAPLPPATFEQLLAAAGQDFYGTVYVDDARAAGNTTVQNVRLSVIVGIGTKYGAAIQWPVWEKDIPRIIAQVNDNYAKHVGVVRVFNLVEEKSGDRSFFKCSHMSFLNFFDQEKNAAYKAVADAVNGTEQLDVPGSPTQHVAPAQQQQVKPVRRSSAFAPDED